LRGAKKRGVALTPAVAQRNFELLTRIAIRFSYRATHKEIHMITNQPIELGSVSEETKHTGVGLGDNPLDHFSQEGT
jgi:hypothetical protein